MHLEGANLAPFLILLFASSAIALSIVFSISYCLYTLFSSRVAVAVLYDHFTTTNPTQTFAFCFTISMIASIQLILVEFKVNYVWYSNSKKCNPCDASWFR